MMMIEVATEDPMLSPGPKISADGVEQPKERSSSFPMRDERQLMEPLANLVRHTLHHPTVLAASPGDRRVLTQEMLALFLVQVTQMENSWALPLLYSRDAQAYLQTPSFFRWVRTTSAEHTACHFVFSFLICLVGRSLGYPSDVFPSAGEKYLASAAIRHLSTLCRMYNDCGSFERDDAEKNINSLHFPDFQSTESQAVISVAEKKGMLLQLAQYERTCIEKTLQELAQEGAAGNVDGGPIRLCNARRMEIMRMYVHLTDLYGQIYVVQDPASRVMSEGVTPQV
ncbi:hypothetical protein JX266_013865 [Neoarthrinium moseri]|nr:hypothetical protein JX266_013865 [Neoarthrinium moseri]